MIFFFGFLFSDIAYFDIKLLPRDDNGNILFPQIPKRLGIILFLLFLHFQRCIDYRRIAKTTRRCIKMSSI